MLPTFELGPFSLPVPGLSLILAVWLGLTASEKLASRYSLSSDKIYNLLLYSLVSGVVGARVSFLAGSFQAFLADPWSVFSLSQTMFDLPGGLIIGSTTFVLFVYKNNLAISRAADGITPFLAVLNLGLGFSHLAGGTAYGAPTNLPWGIDLWGAVRHPTQIYLIISSLIILTVIFISKPSSADRPGKIFLTFLSLTSGSYLFLEAFRGDSNLIRFGIRSRQIISWLILAGSLRGLGKLKYDRNNTKTSG